MEFGQNRFGVQLGITAVLHTWSQTLLDHYHLHCIVTGGGLSEDRSQWVSTPSHYLFAVRALSAVFQGKFCARLEQAQADSELEFHGKISGLAQPNAFKALLRQAVRQKWVVYAKRPFAGPRQVLAYLSRYTHRVAISPKRLLSLDVANQTVTFAWKDYADDSKHKTMRLELKEFVRRFCLHLLPERYVKIRHFAFLGNRQRKVCVAKARELLQTEKPIAEDSTPAPSATASLPNPMRCPYCGSDQLELIEIVEPRRADPPATLDSS